MPPAIGSTSRSAIYAPTDVPRVTCRSPRTSPVLRTVLRYEAGRARRLLGSGAPLTRQLPLQPRIAVCGFVAGGMAALDAIEAARYEVLAVKCRPRPLRLGVRLVGGLLTASAARSA